MPIPPTLVVDPMGTGAQTRQVLCVVDAIRAAEPADTVTYVLDDNAPCAWFRTGVRCLATAGHVGGWRRDRAVPGRTL